MITHKHEPLTTARWMCSFGPPLPVTIIRPDGHDENGCPVYLVHTVNRGIDSTFPLPEYALDALTPTH